MAHTGDLAGLAMTSDVPLRRRRQAPAAVLVVAVVVGAYHYSLFGLLSMLSGDSPVAYVGLVPLLVLGVCVVKARPRPGELRLPDRQVDWMLGLAFLSIAAALAFLLPRRASYQFWTNRLDLLGLPFFAAGAVCIVLGSRVLSRIRLPLAALVLAWPYPYERALHPLLQVTSGLTVWALRGLTAAPTGGQSSIVALGSGSGRFEVNIAPACAGASSALGFLIAGGAALMVLRGQASRKAMWLGVGLVLMLALNVLRLVVLLLVGARWGAPAAMTWVHPYAGLVVFATGMLLLLSLLPAFGIGPSPAPTLDLDDRRASSRTLTSRAVVVAAAGALLLGHQNGRLGQFDPFASLSLAPAGASLATGAVSITGRVGTLYDDVSWAGQFFGPGSSWARYVYTPATPGPAAGGPLYMDVVTTADLSALSRFGIEKCYRFHGERVRSSGPVDVGRGAAGQELTFDDGAHVARWVVVSWTAPVATTGGTRFERVVLLAPSSPGEAPATLAALRGTARDVVTGRAPGAARGAVAPG